MKLQAIVDGGDPPRGPMPLGIQAG